MWSPCKLEHLDAHHCLARWDSDKISAKSAIVRETHSTGFRIFLSYFAFLVVYEFER